MRRIAILAALAAMLWAGQASAAEPITLVSFGDCANGRCQTGGPVQATAQYFHGVGQAVVAPLRSSCSGTRKQPVRDAIRRLFGKQQQQQSCGGCQ